MNICPGQNLAFMDPEKAVYYVACGNCETDVEFWYDDKKRTCDNCGEKVQPDLDTLMQYQSCSSYCSFAFDCLGEDKYTQLILKEIRPKVDARAQLEKILGLVPPDEDRVKEFLKSTMEKNAENGYLLETGVDLKGLENDKYDVVIDVLKSYVRENYGKKEDN